MAGYQRFVAYVYEYLKGKKGSNCGFIKVEVREQRCRLELHLQCPGIPAQAECRIYGIVRNGGLMDGHLLGICKTGDGTARCMIETDALNMNDSGIGLGKMGGLIMETEGGAFFGTEWDDIPIRPENFREVRKNTEEPSTVLHSERGQEIVREERIQKEKEENRREENGREENGQEEKRQEENMQEENRQKENMQEGNIQEENMEEEGSQEENTQKKNTHEENISGAEESLQRNSHEHKEEETHIESRNETETENRDGGPLDRNNGMLGSLKTELVSQSVPNTEMPMNSNISFQAEEDMDQREFYEQEVMPGMNMDEGSMKNNERIERNPEEENRDRASMEEGDRMFQPTRMAPERPQPTPPPRPNRPQPTPPPRPERPQPTPPPRPERPQPTPPPRPNRPQPTPSPRPERPQPTPPPMPPRRPSQGQTGEAFLPFEDEAVTDCRKIQIKDLARLNRRDIPLRNNRFLQYGYYNFGHLLICRRADGRYILGVPGGYDQQERFMANMFGFPYFKESRYIQLPKGRGGYWYRLINTPDFH